MRPLMGGPPALAVKLNVVALPAELAASAMGGVATAAVSASAAAIRMTVERCMLPPARLSVPDVYLRGPRRRAQRAREAAPECVNSVGHAVFRADPRAEFAR